MPKKAVRLLSMWTGHSVKYLENIWSRKLVNADGRNRSSRRIRTLRRRQTPMALAGTGLRTRGKLRGFQSTWRTFLQTTWNKSTKTAYEEDSRVLLKSSLSRVCRLINSSRKVGIIPKWRQSMILNLEGETQGGKSSYNQPSKYYDQAGRSFFEKAHWDCHRGDVEV